MKSYGSRSSEGTTSGMDVSSRFDVLDAVFLHRGSQQDARDTYYSVETLLDSLMVLYQECCSSSMRRERNIAEFVESGMPACVLVSLVTKNTVKLVF